MTQVDSDTDLVHLADRSVAPLAQAGVAGFQASIPEGTAVVVCELHDTNTQLPKGFDARRIGLEETGVLKAGHDPDLGFGFRARDVRIPPYDGENVRRLLDQRIHIGEAVDRSLERRGRNSKVDSGYAGAPDNLDRSRARQSFVAGEWAAERIDNDALAVEFRNFRRELCNGIREHPRREFRQQERTPQGDQKSSAAVRLGHP